MRALCVNGSEFEARAAGLAAIAVDAAAEPLLDLRGHDRGLSPGGTRPLIGRLRAAPRHLAGDVVLDAVARDGSHAAVPMLAGTRVVRALAEGVARPRGRCDDVALGE